MMCTLQIKSPPEQEPRSRRFSFLYPRSNFLYEVEHVSPFDATIYSW